MVKTLSRPPEQESDLAQLDGPSAASALRPLADAYDHWLGRQEERLTDPLLKSHA